MNPKKRHLIQLKAPNAKRRMASLRVRRILEAIDTNRPGGFLVEDPIYDQLLPEMEKLVEQRIIHSWYYVYNPDDEAIVVSFSSESLRQIAERKAPTLTLKIDGSRRIVYSCSPSKKRTWPD